MLYEPTPKVLELKERLLALMDAHIYPNEKAYEAQIAEGDRWDAPALMDDLKGEARRAGLWNLFLPESDVGAGLTNLEYAHLCEIMGRLDSKNRALGVVS